MPATTANQWTDSFAVAGTFVIPDPINSSRTVFVNPTAGNWLVAFVGWRTGAGAQTTPTVHVADDAHNLWIPLARVNSAGGGCAIWVAPNPRKARRVYVAPTDYVTALVTNVTEYAGMGQHLQLASTPVKGFTNGGTSLALGALSAPASEALTLTCAGTDSTTATLTSATAGWTSGTAVAASNGADTISDARLLPRWQSTTGGPSVTYTTSASCNIHAVSVAVLVAAPTPAQSNPNWPIVRFEAGFGSGQQAPRDEITWTNLTTRLLSLDTSHGKQFELSGVEAGTSQLRLRNDDGALDPENASSPYWPDVLDYTPVRVTATWQGRVYGVLHDFAERWPQSWRDPHWGEVNMTAIDAWATLATKLTAAVEGEILLDAPYGYWPLSDPDTSTVGSNLAPNNPRSVVMTPSKEGIGTNVQVGFGADASALKGSAGTAWAQSGLTTLQGLNGYSLVYAPAMDMPLLTGAGVTVEVWARHAAGTQPTSDREIFVLKETAGSIITLFINSSGFVAVGSWNATTHTRSDTVTAYAPTDAYVHYVLAVTTTTWTLWINSQQVASGSGTHASRPHWFSICGQADQRFHGRMFNGSFAHAAIYPRRLPYGRMVAHYWSGLAAMERDSADQRIGRLLSYAGWGQARAISYTTYAPYAPAVDIAGRPVSGPVQDVADSEGGVLYVDGHGYLRFTAKQYRYGQPPAYTFGDRPDLGEVPYDIGMEADWDPAQSYNDITVTQQYYGTSTRVTDAASIQRRGWRDTERQSLLADAEAAADQARYLLDKYKTPSRRIQTIILDPAGNPGIWPAALGVEQGDVVRVNRRPIGAPPISGIYEVIAKAHSVDFGEGKWKVILSLGPGDPDVLMVDDPVFGLLNGSNVIGW
ncbi:LamG-like jellyroll fold domain-containing protein [Acrocarpospora catenulata]|uniref:LamG-like jellyroll fold domain-containing protein n=1 Tax=Acrocarpospora catenulata TaxID=2836182 RepID=UPI001BDA4D0E|nr:LamG-like jellyroll fold domain-containing protein [Acrocarpospora catenulata]